MNIYLSSQFDQIRISNIFVWKKQNIHILILNIRLLIFEYICVTQVTWHSLLPSQRPHLRPSPILINPHLLLHRGLHTRYADSIHKIHWKSWKLEIMNQTQIKFRRPLLNLLNSVFGFNFWITPWLVLCWRLMRFCGNYWTYSLSLRR